LETLLDTLAERRPLEIIPGKEKAWNFAHAFADFLDYVAMA
jgi:hypothetical protein